MALSLSTKKAAFTMLTAVILAVSTAVSVSAESGTIFSFTPPKETVIEDNETSENNASAIQSNDVSPQTGDNTERLLWEMLLTGSGTMFAILRLNRKKKAK